MLGSRRVIGQNCPTSLTRPKRRARCAAAAATAAGTAPACLPQRALRWRELIHIDNCLPKVSKVSAIFKATNARGQEYTHAKRAYPLAAEPASQFLSGHRKFAKSQRADF